MPTEEEIQSREEDGFLGGIESPLFGNEGQEPEKQEGLENRENPQQPQQ